MARILIAGGTGCLGSLVANRLHDRGLAVRVLSRGVAPRPGTIDPDVEVVRADVRDPASLRTPMEGVDLVVSAVQGFMGPAGATPQSVDHDGNVHLIEAAEKAGADVVMVSVIGASPESPMELMRAKYAAEQRLRSSGSAWTILRPEAYAETWAQLLERTAGRSRRPLVFGRGDNPVSWVSVADVAALVERAVLDDTLRGRVLEICGPDPVTLTRLAELVMAQHGWPGTPRHVPRPILQVMANTVGLLKPVIARQARAALAMDVFPTTNDRDLRSEFPDLPCTPVSAVVAAL
ncbi:MAG: SDR family oxidoreductase [Ornithinibacter sp.]